MLGPYPISIVIYLWPLAMDGLSLYMCVDGWIEVITLPNQSVYKALSLCYGVILFGIQ